jgi:hypothetical protein
LAGDAHAHAAAFELDFGEAGLVQELRELPDHVMIDGGAFGLVGGVFRRPCHAHFLRAGELRAASPSIASA